MNVTFIGREATAANIYTFHFKPEKPANFEPGQYTQIKLPHQPEDKRGHKRWFTLSSSPTEPDLTITTKMATLSGSSFKANLMKVAVGTKLELAKPDGDFTLDKDPNKMLVFVAGGIGITPFHSIIKYLHDKNQERPIQLIYGANTPEDFAFRELFDNTPAISQVRYVVREPAPGWDGSTGILGSKTISDLAGGLEGKLVYLSGPEPMVEALESELHASGQDKKQIKTDFFPGYEKY